MPSYLSPGVYVEEVPPLARPIVGVGTSTPGFIGVIPDTVQIPAPTISTDAATDIARGYKYVDVTLPAAASAHFITTWSQYTTLFGDFVGDSSAKATTAASPAVNTGQNNLAHAVYGFFDNGGAGCYVTRVATDADLPKALTTFAQIDDISMVAAPGLTGSADYAALEAHCAKLLDRVAILDCVQTDGGTAFATGDFTPLENAPSDSPAGVRPPNSDYSAAYFPWIQVSDPTSALIGANATPPSTGLIWVPPSGHIAGIYASVDASRGVFKAPANVAVQGATALQWLLAKADQDNLSPKGVNIIRALNGALLVWGARTVGGDANGDFKYISTRRYFIYLSKSIEQGTQFVVFEPNNSALWQRIIRSVSDFLLNEWSAGALFGDTPQQAFFVKCDADTNPPSVVEAGQVVTEIGVAIVQPAEFVIFRIQQTTGG
jgi:hypothetical protein